MSLWNKGGLKQGHGYQNPTINTKKCPVSILPKTKNNSQLLSRRVNVAGNPKKIENWAINPR
jgi:hypothetical protein